MSLLVHHRGGTVPLRLTLTTGPTAEPISKTEARLHLRVDVSDDDNLISSIIKAARQACEEHTNRVLITQTWTMFMDFFPFTGADAPLWEGVREAPETILGGAARYIEIPKPPLISVTSIKIYDDDDAGTEFDASNYFVDTATEPGRVALRTGQSWPTPTRTINGVEVIFKAGYGTAGSNVPGDLMHGMYLLIGHLYENREHVVVGSSVSELPFSVQSFWDPKRIIDL